MMRKGIYQGCFPDTVSTARCVQQAADLGFDGIELTMEDPAPLTAEAEAACTEDILAIGRSVGMTTTRTGALTIESSPDEIEQVGHVTASAGIRVHSLATMMLFFYPLSSPLRSLRDKGIDVVLHMLRAASHLGADTVLIYPGLVTPTVGYREVYRRSQAIVRDLAAEAERLGVAMALETVWNRFLQSPLEMVDYIDEIGSDYVGAYVDVANLLRLGYPQDWLHILGSRVRGVHFKDYRRDVDNILGFTHLLHGDVDWPAVVDALRAIDYTGFVTVEVPPIPSMPEHGPREAKAALDMILAHASSRRG